MTNFVSIRQASNITGYSVEHIRKLLRDGAVKGQKVVTVWTIDLDDLQRHKEQEQWRVTTKQE